MKSGCKRILSAFLAITMLMTSILCVDLSAFASELNIKNRAEWLSTLVETFDMTVESDNYPDNYFSDLTEESEYYRDVLVATEYGLISVEAGDPIYPEDELTREFAAQTLNACLNFQLEENEDGGYDYTFADVEECSFPYDDQIAVNRQWFELVDNNFCPNDVVKPTEITAMLDDAMAQIEITNVDENYDSTVELADGVVEIPNGTELSIDENNKITVIDCPVAIEKGDNFTAYFYDLPNAYVAESVKVDGNKTIITTQEANTKEVFEDIDIQEVSQINDAEFIPAEGITVEPDVQPVSTFSRSRASTPVNALNNVKIGGDLSIDGWIIALNAKMSNPVLETNITSNKTYVALKTDIDLSYSVSTKTSSKLNQTNKTSKVIPVGYINILGVGFFKVSFEVSLSGGITVNEKFSLKIGESYTKGENLRIISDYTHKDFSIIVDATVKAGFKIELGVSIVILKADIYASVGFAAKCTLIGYPNSTPSSCLNIVGYMYLDVGAELTINYFFNSLHFGVEKAIIDSTNSPVKIAFHFEDGKKVHECTRGKTPKYLTPSDSKHSNSADDCVNNYENVDTSSFTYTVRNGNATITKYTGNSSIVVIPEYIDGYKVTSIGRSAFENCTSLTSVTIPDSVTSIVRYAFYDCTSLTSVTIPNSVTDIGEDAFSNCESLTSVTIPNSVKSIGNSAFAWCESLTSVTIPNSVTRISEGSFARCTSLTSVAIPNSVKSIGDNAFLGCESLTSITIPNSVTSIGYRTFWGCTSLTSVTIGNSVTSIGDGAFYDCTSLTSITIPDSVTTIGNYAFENVNNIVYNGTASGSPWRAKAVNGYVDGYLVYEDSTKEKLLGCSSQATSVTIPDSVTVIGYEAFYNCTSLTSVTIPDSVTSIGARAFYDCTSLTDVNYTGSKEEWNKISIGSDNKYLKNKNIHYNYIPPCEVHTPASPVEENRIEPQCEINGSYESVVYCSVCNSVISRETVTIPMLNHNYVKEVTKPTCTEQGYTTHTCKICNDTYFDSYVDSVGHKPATAVKENIKKATCTTAGSYDSVVYCSVCKREISRTKETTSKLGHNYKVTKAAKPATCTVNGNTEQKTCTRCNAVTGGVVIKATGHKYDLGKITVKATCGKAGTKTYTCTVCKATKKETIKATGKHTYGTGKVTKAPTSSATGVMTYTCKTCGAKKTSTIAKLVKTSISKLTAKSKGYTVAWNKVSSASGYQIQYSTSSKFTNPKTVTITGNSTTSKAITKLTAKKRYYVRVRTYKTINGTRYYSSWSGYKYITTKA